MIVGWGLIIGVIAYALIVPHRYVVKRHNHYWTGTAFMDGFFYGRCNCGWRSEGHHREHVALNATADHIVANRVVS